LRNIHLEDSLHDVARRPGTSSFREVSTAFACGERQIKFQNVLLVGPSERMEGSGSVDFSQNLDFRFRQLSDESAPQTPGDSSAPLIARTAGAAGKPAKLGKPAKSDSSQKTNDASIQLTGVLSAPVIVRKANAEPR
jgi:hypothetical protein